MVTHNTMQGKLRKHFYASQKNIAEFFLYQNIPCACLRTSVTLCKRIEPISILLQGLQCLANPCGLLSSARSYFEVSRKSTKCSTLLKFSRIDPHAASKNGTEI